MTSRLTVVKLLVGCYVSHHKIVNPPQLYYPVAGKFDEKEALSTNKRSKHEYSRNTNFEHIVNTYDSHKAPKCKVNLTPRLAHTAHEPGNASSRSSLYSISSIEWDGRCKSDFSLRTRSLPRSTSKKLFRTQSHSGFINSYMRDPEPMHYHIPRCRSCGATNVSYAFEINKDEKLKKLKKRNSIYFSSDNIPQKCSEEANSDTTCVKVQEKLVPVFKVEKKGPEFVESQEFNEDNYIGDIGNSFSSENQTVIETSDTIAETVVVGENNVEMCIQCTDRETVDTYTANLVAVDSIDNVNKSLESIEGEYHSFTDLEDSYESPVKQLVEKDIRDYSVPIDFYCEDFKSRDDAKKSPLKIKNILEPILEESKSSYGDDSNLSQNDKKEELMKNIVGEAVNTAVLASQLKLEIASNVTQKVTTESLIVECSKLESYSVNEEGSDVTVNDVESFTTSAIQTAIDVYETEPSEQDLIDCVYENVFEILSTENESDAEIVKRQNSLASTLSSNERNSIDSTAEFEKYEIVSEVLSAIINRIDVVDLVLKVKVAPDNNIPEHDLTTDEYNETFSMAKLIEDIEQNVCLNETVLTDVSETDTGLANKIIEGVLYYIFDRAMFINHQKQKGIKKTVKRVVTVAEFEDILFTARPIWMESENNEDIHFEENHSEEKDFNEIKDFFNAQCLKNEEEKYVSLLKDNVELKSIDKVLVSNVTDTTGRGIKTNYCNIGMNESSAEVKESNKVYPQHKDEVYNTPDEVETGHYIHSLVHNITDEENTSYCKYIELDQEFISDLTYAIEKPGTDESALINNNLDKAIVNTLEEVSSILINDISRPVDENVLNETFMDSSDMNNAFHEDFNQSDEHIISSHTEKLFATPDVAFSSEIKENINLEPETFTVGNVTDVSHEDYHSTGNGEFKDIFDCTDDYASFSAQSPARSIEEYLSPIKEPFSPNEEPIFSPEYRNISQKTVEVSESRAEKSDRCRKRKHTTVKEAQSRSSSPNRKTTKKFELTESPIKSVLKDSLKKQRARSDVPSPFTRKANVLAMSQTEHSGGVKYWLSFDEHLPLDHDNHVVRTVKSIDDTLPSFISIDLDDDIEGKSNPFYENKTNKNTKRMSVLLNEYSADEVSFPCPGTSNMEYATRDNVELDGDSDTSVPRKRLLYELHSRPSKRLYSSWPPFEDTVFYRIISKFRMSESFDPNDLEDTNFDCSC